MDNPPHLFWLCCSVLSDWLTSACNRAQKAEILTFEPHFIHRGSGRLPQSQSVTLRGARHNITVRASSDIRISSGSGEIRIRGDSRKMTIVGVVCYSYPTRSHSLFAA